MQTVVHQLSHLLWSESFTTGEIRTTNVTDKERIAGQYFLRLWRNGRVDDKNTDALRSMTGSFHEPQHKTAQRQFIPVLHWFVRERRICLSAKNNRRSCSRGKYLMTADEVGVEMSLDNVFDFEPVIFGLSDVLINVALRIDTRSPTAGADQVRSMGQTT